MRDPAFDPPQEKYEVPSLDEATRTTPSMAQYIEIKAANPDCMLFYRMGDFYELFFSDAEIAAQTLNIVLTRRGKHAGMDIPMCGVPVQRADDYLHKLIAAGHKVAVCEQMEDPAEARKRGAKSIVRRDVVRIVTRGTLTEENLLDARRANWLVALARIKKEPTKKEKNPPRKKNEMDIALAAVDISTGQSHIRSVSLADLGGEIARMEPSELLVPDDVREDAAYAFLFTHPPYAIARLAQEGFDPASAQRRICDFFALNTLEALGEIEGAELSAFAAILVYLERTQLKAKPILQLPQRFSSDETMVIDAATRANLELIRTLSGHKAGSLLSVIDRTLTSGGGRMLSEWLASPLTERVKIEQRHQAIADLLSQPALIADLREKLRHVPDMPRALARIALLRAGPRDLAAIAAGILEAGAIARLLAPFHGEKNSLLQEGHHALLSAPHELAHNIRAALREELPIISREGGFIREGFDAVIDELNRLHTHSREVVAQMQASYIENTEIRQLKVKHNNTLGYFIEVPQQTGERLLKAPFNLNFIHRQTMAGTMRFSTQELAALEQKINEAAENLLKRELEHFASFSREILEKDAPIRAVASALARLDVLVGLADLAQKEGWVQPILSEDSTFLIEGGRHPVVEWALKREGEGFVANRCDLSAPLGTQDGRILLVTGANMAGKSTYLRQNALIVLLAQMGSFVPAQSARLGVVDRLFSRVGAADDLARGRSTFMVEMVETATILNQATARSLVILDEIGRGTATYDGLSIAWASVEHLHNVIRCRGLFATHFHELTQLTDQLNRLHPITMKVSLTRGGDVVFLHEVVMGAADRSYGVQVAQRAGLPKSVVQRAAALLHEFENKDKTSARLEDLPLFSPSSGAAMAITLTDQILPPSALTLAINNLNPDIMTPREALEAVYHLKNIVRGEG